MNFIREYSDMCDVVLGISSLNISKEHTVRQQKYLSCSINKDDDHDDDYNLEQYEEFKLHYNNKYNDFNTLMDFDLMEYVIPFSSFLTNKLNEYLLNIMLEFTSIKGSHKQLNITDLINHYHFCLNFTSKFYSFQSKLEELDAIQDKTARQKYLKYARNEMSKYFPYSKLNELYDFVRYCKYEIEFDVKHKIYDNLEKHKKIYLKQSYYLICDLEDLIKSYMDYGDDFDLIKARDKLQIIKPFHNITQFFLLIVMK